MQPPTASLYPVEFAVCKLCFSLIQDTMPGVNYPRSLVQSTLWIAEDVPAAHRLAKEDDHVVTTVCGHTYSVDSPALLPVMLGTTPGAPLERP